jgi:hypothetical protein
MAFYSATNPIVLIEFIDIKDISNPDASQGPEAISAGIVVSTTCEKDWKSRKPQMCSRFPLG